MAITIVGVGTVDSASPWAPSVAGPVLADDIILILVEQASLTTPEASPAATGYAHVLGSPVGPDSSGTVLSVLWKRAVGGETSATVTGPSNHAVTRTITLRGVKATGNPWNINPGVATEGNGVDTGATWPTVTTTATDCLICLCIATGRDAASTANLGAVTNANLTSLTERMDNWVQTGTGGGIGLVTGFKATAGAVGTSTATMGSTDGKALMTLALEPAATVAPDPIGKAGCVLWLKESAAGDNTTTTSWTDDSGTGNTVANASSTVTHQTNEINALPVERFTGTTNSVLTKSSAVGLTTAWTVALVHRPTDVTGPDTLLNFGTLGTNGVDIVMVSGRLSVYQANGALAAETASTLTNGTVYRHVITCDASGNVLIYTNGSLDTQNATARTFSYTTPAVQVGAFNTTPAEFYGGDLGELVAYNTVASSGERADLDTYFGRWVAAGGVTVTPATIAVTAALPRPLVDVAASPATLAAVAALPASNRTIGAGPATLTATTALPRTAVNVTAGPAVLQAVTALPRPLVNVGAGPATIPAVAGLPQATPGISGDTTATPATIATVVTLPRTLVDVTATPATFAAVTALGAAHPNIGAGPATITTLTAMVRAAVDVTASPAAVPLLLALPTPTISAGGSITVQPVTITTVVALPQPAANTLVRPATLPVVVALPQAAAGQATVVTPATFAAVTALPRLLVNTTVGPATIGLLVTLPLVERVGGGVVAGNGRILIGDPAGAGLLIGTTAGTILIGQTTGEVTIG